MSGAELRSLKSMLANVFTKAAKAKDKAAKAAGSMGKDMPKQGPKRDPKQGFDVQV